MREDFHDKFTDIQSDMIGLCLEMLDNNADKVYAYAFNSNDEIMFNGFFAIDGNIKKIGAIDVDFEVFKEFFKIGTSDIERIVSLCKENGVPSPVEMKMVYDVKTGEFDADYDYSKEIPEDMTAVDLFNEWIEEVKRSK